MKRYFYLAALALGCCGCVTIPNSVVPHPAPVPLSDQVTPGMTFASVAAVMNGKVVVGYELDPATGASRPILSQRLYSSELLSVNGKKYKVDRYIIRAAATGVAVSEAELFPVVYQDGLVVAKGPEGLARIRLEK